MSLSDDLGRIANDSRFNDVTLQGSDGIKVPTSRLIVSARSGFLRNMFYERISPNSELKSNFKLAYPSRSIRTVLQYCYTDKLIGFDDFSDENAQEMLNLYSASKRFELDGLNKHVNEWCTNSFKKYPELACALLEAAVTNQVEEAQICNAAVKTIRENAASALYPARPGSVGKGMAGISSKCLYKILADKKIDANEMFLFNCIVDWAGIDPVNRLPSTSDLIDRIELTRIKPDDLLQHVTPSGLVPAERLLDANSIHQVCMRRMSKDDIIAIAEMSRAQFHGGLSITAKSAGLEEVNGLYIAHGMNGGLIRYYNYSFSLTPSGKKSDIEMYRPSTLEPRWEINKTAKDGKQIEVTNVLTMYYESSANGSFGSVGGDSCIPKRGWHVHDSSVEAKGLDPPPSMTYRYFHNSA